ncbi:MAG: 50S ribosomal protein L24 [Bacteroidota bacterium]
MAKLKIKKGDTVQVIAGDDKGKIGRVLEVYPKTMKILVEQVNVHKKHTRPNQQYPNGGVISKELPIHYSNVMIVDSDKKPTRIGIRHEIKGGRKETIRFARTNNKDL